MNRYILTALSLLFGCFALAQQTPKESSTTLFEKGINGYHTFRIPAVVMANDGSLLAFAEGRKNGSGDTGNIDLVMRRSADGGKTWGDIITIWDDSDNVCGNPAPVVDQRTGRVVLLSTWNRGDDHEPNIHRKLSKDTRRIFIFTSNDNGLSWSAPKEITTEVKNPEWNWYATGPCHGIQLQQGEHKGRLVIPCDYGEAISGEQFEGANTHSHVIYSDNGGDSWAIGGESDKGANECTVVELKNGDLLLNMRGARWKERLENGPYRVVARSVDAGESFDEMFLDSNLTEPVCQASILNYTKHGKISNTLLFCNPDHPTKRANMTVKISRNAGETWKNIYILTPEGGAYSDMVQLTGGRIGVLYEEISQAGGYDKITFDILPASIFK